MKQSSLLLIVTMLGCFVSLLGQSDPLLVNYRLESGQISVAQAIRSLSNAGANLTFRDDHLPDNPITLPGRRRSLGYWLRYLLKDTELTFQANAANASVTIFRDPDIVNQYFTLHGLVYDQNSGERLINANFYLPDIRKGGTTNEYGFYALRIKGGRVKMRVSYVGYAEQSFDFVLRADSSINIRMRPDLSLTPIVVTARTDSMVGISSEAGGITIGLGETSQIGGIGGESDPMRLASLLPGVNTGADGLGGIIMRGSDASHNLILLDGVPVYNLNHAYGLFSIFNAQAIKRVDLYKNGIPTRFGGRLAGVVDVHTRDGNLNEHEFIFSSSLLSSRFTAEGPIKRGKSSFLLSGRYFWATAFLPTLATRIKRDQGLNGSANYQLYDLNFKFNQTISEKDRVYLSLYKGLDELDNFSNSRDTITSLGDGGVVFRYDVLNNNDQHSRWGNTVGALRWNRIMNDQLFGNFSLSYSTLDLESNSARENEIDEIFFNQNSRTYVEERFASTIQQLSVAFDGQWQPEVGKEVRFGTKASWHEFAPLILDTRDVPLQDLDNVGSAAQIYQPKEFISYLEYVLRKPDLQLRLGSRLQLWDTGLGKRYFNVLPRFMLNTAINDKLTWQTSFDATVQPVHLLGTQVIGLPSDIWVPSTDQLAPAKAFQLSTSFKYFLPKSWEVELAAYGKRMNNLVLYRNGRNLTGEWESRTSVGNGTAYGMELSLHRRAGKIRGWLGYTLGYSTRNFGQEINLGRTFPFRYDRRHSASMVFIYQPNERSTLTLSWLFGTGAAYSFSLQSFQLQGVDINFEDPELTLELVNNRNGFRLPANHRLDFNYRFSLKQKRNKRWRHSFLLGVYNVYDRHNPIYYDLRTNYRSGRGELIADRSFVQVFISTVSPIFAYELQFGGKGKPIPNL